MAYIDGFLVPVPKSKVAAYMKMSRKAGREWKRFGALEYRECVADDVNPKMLKLFGGGIKLKPSETVVFSWIVYKSKADRNRVNKKVMALPEFANMDPAKMEFDWKRMGYGGFKVQVDL
jgi:uncharacterized protein YbaA (DUF1428 family)